MSDLSNSSLEFLCSFCLGRVFGAEDSELARPLRGPSWTVGPYWAWRSPGGKGLTLLSRTAHSLSSSSSRPSGEGEASEGLLGEAPGAGFLRMSQAGAPVWNSSPDSPEMEQGGL